VTAAPPQLIPFRWPAEWQDPAASAFLKGTPINCLAGFAPPPVPVGGMRFIKLEQEGPPPGITLRDGVWPRVLPAKEEDAALAGVTGGPWVDSNAGVIRLEQARATGRQVWLTYSPPGPREIVPPEDYVRPIAEAEAYGARWVIALDPQFAQGMTKRDDRALGAWRQMMNTLALFESRRGWREWLPVAALAVVSSFEGGAQLLAEEFLNLAPRRHLAHRVVLSSDVTKHSFGQQKAIIFLESAPPQGEARATLLRFAENGGTVFAPRGIVNSQPTATRQEHAIHQLGRGRVITPLDKWEDPFALVRQVQLLLSIREDVVQVWNGGDMNSHCLSSPDARRGVVHLIPYASGTTLPVTIGLRQPCRSVRVTTLSGTRAVRPVRGALGVEIPVGEFSCFAAVELEA
jgi:hypothetical protein